MRRIGGSEANIQGPYKTKDNDEADSGSMEEDDGDAVSRGDTTARRDSDNMKKDDDSSGRERSDGELAYEADYYQDSDGHVRCCADRSGSESGVETDGSDSGGDIDIRGSSKEELIALLRSGTRNERGFTMRNQDSRPKKDERAYEVE